MKRDLYQKLKEWKESPNRKPLILKGARQVGKTYLVEVFAKSEYPHFASFNFDEDPGLKTLFEHELTPTSLLQKLEIYCEKKIQPEQSLIFFDEIQTCTRALSSLKYFQEKMPNYHIIAAGSLLGIKLEKKDSFPVGKVNFLNLYPLSFFEFLDSVGKNSLRTYLENKTSWEPIEEIFHQQLLELLKQYMVIGGMPEVVARFADHHDFQKVRILQNEILKTYEFDFVKHAEKNDVMKISLLWDSVPKQLAKENKKFMFSVVRESARARDYETAIQWLTDSGLIHKVVHTETIRLPLKAYAQEKNFKVYALDVGLLSARVGLNPKILLEENKLFVEYKGTLTENFVAQELIQKHNSDLYYWTSSGTAEVDFILEVGGEVFPLEVKGGFSRNKKSLRVYGEKYSPKKLSRASLRNFKNDGGFSNYPLYAVSLFPFL